MIFGLCVRLCTILCPLVHNFVSACAQYSTEPAIRNPGPGVVTAVPVLEPAFRQLPRRADPDALYAFSSRLSSFKKRQSVPSAMILLGLRLMNPSSCIR